MPPSAAPRTPLNCDVEIETPEQIRFRYRLAGPAQRAAAYLLDLLVRGFLLMVLMILFDQAGMAPSGYRSAVLLVAVFLMEWAYFVLFEGGWGGRTLGKRALGLRVVRSDGTPLDWGAAVLRNLLRGADFLPFAYGVGLLAMISSREFRRLGDWVADTMVIREELQSLESSVVLPPPRHDERTRWRPSRPLDRDEATLVASLLRRRPRLSPGRAEELATALLERLPGHWDGPAEAPVRVLELLLFQAQAPRTSGNSGRT